MRIIAGKYKGRKLISPRNSNIRPTSDRARESIFNILQSYLHTGFDGLNVVDLFAGAGTLGIEAISRGADQVIFIDRDPVSIELVNKNLETIKQRDLTFAIGPAGTGKTYLAVASAVQRLVTGKIERILLVRPAVEAGEKLGFLPGDLNEKVNPYLRPLYDALFEMLGYKEASNLIDKKAIEVVPLAFMRGRTLNNSFIILDEGQNTTQKQMKMFLTRFGFGSTVVVTGDITQIDLPKDTTSGLMHSLEVLKGLKNVGLVYFENSDVVRHGLVKQIVEAYEKYGKSE